MVGVIQRLGKAYNQNKKRTKGYLLSLVYIRGPELQGEEITCLGSHRQYVSNWELNPVLNLGCKLVVVASALIARLPFLTGTFQDQLFPLLVPLLSRLTCSSLISLMVFLSVLQPVQC